MSRRKRISQREIAEAAGVSQAVVSHVLNNSDRISISPETRDRVHKIIKEYDYVPNRAAQSLRLQKTQTVAVIIPDITNPYYPEYVRGIQDVLMHANYDLTSFNSDGLFDLEVRGLRTAMRAHVDGIIGVFFHLDLEMIRSIVGDEQPLVLSTMDSVPVEFASLPIDTLSIDGTAAGKMVTEHLIQRGHSRIIMLAGQRMTPPRESRVQGFREALTNFGMPESEHHVIDGEFDEEGGYKAMQQALQLEPLPDAVFAANDLIAIGALRACREAGIDVPGTISIAGFDNIPASRMMHPSLTTLDQNSRLTGQRAAELLLSRLSGTYTGISRHEVIPMHLVERDSA